jgi:hypothetical protein
MPLTPQTTVTPPNTIYAAQIVLGMSIQEGVPLGEVRQILLRGANVDENGVWSEAAGEGQLTGVTFRFDAQGNITGLPDDMTQLAPQILQIWGGLVAVIGEINSIRHLV